MLLINLPWRLFIVSLHGKNEMLCLSLGFSLDKIPKIKIFHMVASEHPEVIEGRRWLIATDVPESEEANEYGSLIMMVLLQMKRIIVVRERRA